MWSKNAKINAVFYFVQWTIINVKHVNFFSDRLFFLSNYKNILVLHQFYNDSYRLFSDENSIILKKTQICLPALGAYVSRWCP